jgi:hypothetical protein
MPVEANSIPRMAKARKRLAASISVADTSETGAGTLVTGYTCPNDGSVAFAIVRTLRAVARVNTTAGRIKGYTDTGAAKTKVVDIAVSAVTLSASAAWNSSLVSGANPITGDIPTEITLAPGETIKFAPHNAEAIDVSGEVEEY